MFPENSELLGGGGLKILDTMQIIYFLCLYRNFK